LNNSVFKLDSEACFAAEGRYMKLETYAAHRGVNVEVVIKNFIALNIFNSTGLPRKNYIDKGLFKENGDIINVSEVDKLFLSK
jgi:hypothetical protein